MKKVAKKTSLDEKPVAVLPGKPVKLVVATKNDFWSCPRCNTKRSSGMIFQDKGVDYCSRKCVIG